MRWVADRKLALAKKARKHDNNYIHAQLILAGQKVTKDVIVDKSHDYYFDCGCIRSYSVRVNYEGKESISACERHKGLETPYKR